MVQKQKTSGRMALASAAASVPVCGFPSLGAASAKRLGSMSQIPDTWKPRIRIECRGMVHAALTHADNQN